MKIVLDLQACQSQGSYYRGIGRYARAFTQALVRQAGKHDIHVLMNAALPYYVDEIRQGFIDSLPAEHLHAFSIPTPVKGLEQDNDWRMKVAEMLREYAVMQLQADIFQVSSLFEGMGDDIVTSADHPVLAARTAMTLHDLIPLVSPGEYWSEPTRRAWYFRKLQALKNAGLHLAVSEFSKQEAIEHLALDPERIFTVYNAVSADFKVQSVSLEEKYALLHRYGIDKPFILYAGGVEQRKNVDFLLKAYATLPQELRQQYQLVIAGDLQEWQRLFLAKVARSCGIQNLCITGLLTDADLIALYNFAEVFVFPSLHEGFGLPVLEAMACGAPTLCADNSSLPEVRGWQDALFNASRLEALAHKLHQTLTDGNFRAALREQGLKQAKKFSWDASARQAITIFEEYHERHHAQQVVSYIGSLIEPKPRLACVLRTQNAFAHAAQLMTVLSAYYRLECVVDGAEMDNVWCQANFPRRTRLWMQENPTYYQRCLYVQPDILHSLDEINLMQAQPGVHVWLQAAQPQMPTEIWTQYLLGGYHALISAAEPVTLDAPHALIAHDALGVLVSDDALQWANTVYKDCCKLKILPETIESSWCATRSTGVAVYQFIEQCYQTHPRAHEQTLLDNICQLQTNTRPEQADWLHVAECISANRLMQSTSAHRRLFYDVSVLAHTDNASGIHRVTKNVLHELFNVRPAAFRVEPIYANNGRYYYARQFTCDFLGIENSLLTDDVVEFQPSDVLLVVDLGLDFAVEMEDYLQQLRVRGLQLYYLVHDILAVRLPKAYFDDGIYRLMPRWIAAISRIADGLICTTQAGKQDLMDWLAMHPTQRSVPLRVGVCSLGAELQVVSTVTPLNPQEKALITQIQQAPMVLMVSTVEPRKGYAQALDAFELLWEQGQQLQLVIVGKHGWNVDGLAQRLKQHPEQGKRLHWLHFVSDALLITLYQKATVLLMASEGEGFGLPFIEAAQYGLPVIARDIPVFREIGSEHAFYFQGLDGRSLAAAIQQWLLLFADNKAPKSVGIRWLTWRECTECIKAFILQGDAYGAWSNASCLGDAR